MLCLMMRVSVSVAAICHKSWGSRHSRLPLSLRQFSFLLFPLVDSPEGLDRARSPAAKHFVEMCTVKQPYKIHIDV